MERMSNENNIYNAALYCRLSKDDEQAGESVSIGTQKNLVKLQQEKNKIQKRLTSLKKIIRKLYEDFAEDLLDTESYHEMLSEYTQEQKKLSARLSMLDVELNGQEDYEKNVEKLKSVLEEYLIIEELTETMVNQ